MSLEGKTALITGGAGGIGGATAELFASKGARVIVADVAEEAGRALVARLGGDHRFVRLNVSSKEDWEERLGEIAPDGKLDIALLNAAVMTRPTGTPGYNDPLPWITPQSMDRLLGVNFYGVLWGMMTCLPIVEKTKGTIMVTSSAGGLQPVAFDPPYSATKYAVIGLACSFAPSFLERGVRVVTVCPHSVDTAQQPPDVQQKKWDDGYSSPPSHMAMSMLHIYENAAAGDIWHGKAGELPYLVGAPKIYKAY